MGFTINSHLEASKTAQASASAIKGSVQKVNRLARLIAGESAANALLQLQFSDKGQSDEIRKVLYAAISNAENNMGLDIDRLVVSEVKVGKAFKLKRFSARGRGRASRIEKPYSRITIFVTEKGE